MEKTKKRPTSITVIGGFLIFSGVTTIISFIYLYTSQFSLLEQSAEIGNTTVKNLLIMSALGATISLASAIGFLKGQNWARILYVCWSIIGILNILIKQQIKTAIIPSLLIFVLVCYFLFNKKANEFFKEDSL